MIPVAIRPLQGNAAHKYVLASGSFLFHKEQLRLLCVHLWTAHNLFIFRRIDLYTHAGMQVPHFGISDQSCQSYTQNPPAFWENPLPIAIHQCTPPTIPQGRKTINCRTKLDKKWKAKENGTAVPSRPYFCRTNIKQFSILFWGPTIWNSLPVTITSCSSSTFVF